MHNQAPHLVPLGGAIGGTRTVGVYHRRATPSRCGKCSANWKYELLATKNHRCEANDGCSLQPLCGLQSMDDIVRKTSPKPTDPYCWAVG